MSCRRSSPGGRWRISSISCRSSCDPERPARRRRIVRRRRHQHVELRAMGPQRTLVLVDGARVSPADRDGSVHMDNIPTALISQVEVVTGGASAAYGADALAGVVNFRINRKYEGFDLNVGELGTTDAGIGDNASSRSRTARSSASVGISSVRSRTRNRSDRVRPERARRLVPPLRNRGEPGVDVPATRASRSGSCCPTSTRETMRRPAGSARPATLPEAQLALSRSVAKSSRTTAPACGRSPPPAQSSARATGNQSGGTEVINGMTEASALIERSTAARYGAEVERSNFFAGLHVRRERETQLFREFARVDGPSRTTTTSAASRTWRRLERPDLRGQAYLPANVRQAMVAQGVNNSSCRSRAQWLGQSGQLGRRRGPPQPIRQLDLAVRCRQGSRRKLEMEARIQRGATDRLSQCTTRFASTARCSRSTRSRCTTIAGITNGDGIADVVRRTRSRHGHDHLQRATLQSDAAQLQASVANMRVPAAQGDDSLGNGGSDIPGADSSPVGPDAIPNCVPMNIFGQGNVSDAAARLRGLAEVRCRRRDPGVRRGAVHGDIYEGYGPGAFSMAVGGT